MDSIQKINKSTQARLRQSIKAKRKLLSLDWQYSSYSSCAHTKLQKISALKCFPFKFEGHQSIKSSQTSLGLAIKQFFHIHYRERKKHVKSAYKLAVKITNSSMHGESSWVWRDKRIWRKLWKLYVPPKVKHCVWRGML